MWSEIETSLHEITLYCTARKSAIPPLYHGLTFVPTQPEMQVPFANNAEVPVMLKKELGGVCKACFSNDTPGSRGRSNVQKDMREVSLECTDWES